MSKTNILAGTKYADVIDSADAKPANDTVVLVQAGAGPDRISLRDGHWATGSSGDDVFTGVGLGTFGVRFDDSPGPVLLRSDWGRVENDGFGNRDLLRGINAFIGSAFADTLVGSRANDQFGSLDLIPTGGDSYVGGGGFDTVYYGGASHDFKLDLDAEAGRVRVIHLASGVIDTLESIESIEFLDKSVELGSKTNSSFNIYASASGDLIESSQWLPIGFQSRWGDLRAGDGDDTILWSRGQIYPGPGEDTITFASGRSDARVNYGDDPSPVLIDLGNGYAIDGWGSRDDFVNVGAAQGSWRFADTILGSNDDDVFEYSDGGDTIDGKSGNDKLWVWANNNKVTVSFDADRDLYILRMESGRYVYFKNIETLEIGRNGKPNEYLKVSELALAPEITVNLAKSPIIDSTYTGSAANEIILIPDSLWVDPGGGFDTISGLGLGSFGIRFDTSPNPVNIRADWGRVLDDGWGFQDQLRGINAFIGSSHSDTIQGSWQDESFGDPNAPPRGSDTYIGYGGQDTVYYGATYEEFSINIDRAADSARVTYLKTGSTDLLSGITNIIFKNRTLELKQAGGSNDELYFGVENEQIVESDLIKDNTVGRWRHLYAGGGDDRIVWSSGQFHGEEGNDTIEFSRSDLGARLNYGKDPSAVYVNLQNQYAIDGWGDKDVLVNVRAVRGSQYADTMLGSSGDDWFDDPFGGDTIDGAAGNDTIWFWAHNKNYVVSFDTTTELYTVRWGSGWGRNDSSFSFKNIETIRVTMPGQVDQVLAVSNIGLVSSQVLGPSTDRLSHSIISGGNGSDSIYLTNGQWAAPGSGYDQITGVGFGVYGIRFDASPKGVTVRADWGRVEDDGFGFQDALAGVNAYFGSPFNDYLRGSWWDEYFGSSTEQSKGNDTYIGGGGFDTVLYSENRENYELTYDRVLRKGEIKNLKTGTVDWLEGISEISFTDQTISLSSFGDMVNELWGSEYDDRINKQDLLPADRWDYWVSYNGGEGNDSIVWRSGGVKGGRGEDTIEALGDGRSVFVNFDNGPRGAYVNLAEAFAIDEWGSRDTLKNIFQVGGNGNRADTIIGSEADELVTASSGGDYIDLGGGQDLFHWFASTYSVSISTTGDLILRDGPGTSGMSTLRNVETVKFRYGGDIDVPVSKLLASAKPETLIDVTKDLLKSPGTIVRGTPDTETTILAPGTWTMASSGFDSIKAKGTGVFGIRFDESPAGVEVRLGWGPWGTVQNDGYGFRDELIGINAFFGSAYNDVFYGDWRDQNFGSSDSAPRGNDTYIGGGGFDIVRYFDNRSAFKVEKISGGVGNDQKYSVEYLKTGAKDTLEGIASIQFADQTLEVFSWGTGRKIAWGSSESDVVSKSDFFSGDDLNRWHDLRGLEGDDRIIWQNGDVFGGAGNDTIEVAGNDPNSVTVQFGSREGGEYGAYVNLLEGYAIDEWGDRDTLLNVRRVGLTGGADTVIGSIYDDYFWDSGGHDVIDGGLGLDTFSIYVSNKGGYAIKVSDDLSEVILSWDGQKNGWASGGVTLKNFEMIQFGRDGANDYLKVSDLVDWREQAPKALTAGDLIRWGKPGSDVGQAVEITFSFAENMPSYGNGGGGTGFTALDPSQRSIVKVALDAAAEVSGISFKEISDSDAAQIRIGANQQTDTKGYSFLPDASIGDLAGDIWLDIETLQVLDPGKEGFWVLLHELGHALGLVHPATVGEVQNKAVIDQSFDDTRYTVMSENFFTEGQYPLNFSMFDSLALVHLYGAPSDTQTNDIYKIGAGRSKSIQTITDSGGWDLIDASLSATGAYIDLRPGSLLSAGRDEQDYYALYNWAVSYETEIERVVGSDYDDIIIGTDRSEWFFGGDGNDQLDGGAGLDTLQLKGSRSDYEIYVSQFSGRLIVSSVDGESGADSVNEIERLMFSDGGIAFDGNGNAGEAARLVFTMFGSDGVSNASLFGATLSAFDRGQTDALVAETLLSSDWFKSTWGDRSDRAVLKMIFNNLFDRDPLEDELTGLLPLFQIASQSALVAVVADFPFVDDLVGGSPFYAAGIPFAP